MQALPIIGSGKRVIEVKIAPKVTEDEVGDRSRRDSGVTATGQGAYALGRPLARPLTVTACGQVRAGTTR